MNRPGASTRDRLRTHLPTIAVGLPFAALSLHALVTMWSSTTPFGDTAVIGLRTLAASRGRELLGPYSRFGWQHPGPIFFYWAAPFFRVAGMRVGGLAAAAATVNLLWVVLGVTAVRRSEGSRSAWVACAVILLTAWRFGFAWFQNPWNPLLVVLPVAAAGLLAAAVVAGVRWALPALAVAVSFAAQNHVGTAPVLLAILVVALPGAAWQHRQQLRSWLKTIALTAGVCVILWLPTIGEELAHSPGNLSQLIEFFQDHPSPGHPLAEVMRLVGPQLAFTGSSLGARITGPTNLLAPMSIGGALLVVALGVTMLIGCVAGLRAKRPFLWSINAIAMASAVAAVAGTRSAYGDLEAYFTSFSTGVGMLIWIAVALDALALLDRLRGRTRLRPRVERTALAGALVLSATSSVAAWPQAKIHSTANRASVAVMADWATAAMRNRPHDRVLVRFVGPDPWVDGAGMMLELERRGVRVSVRPELYYLFGPAFRSRGNEQMTIIITHSSMQDPRVPAAQGARYLGTNVDGMAVWVADGRVYGPPQAPDDGSAR